MGLKSEAGPRALPNDEEAEPIPSRDHEYPRFPPSSHYTSACNPLCNERWAECKGYCEMKDESCVAACESECRVCLDGCP